MIHIVFGSLGKVLLCQVSPSQNMCDILRRWGTQTRIKLKIPIFWTKFVQKKYFRLKTEKTELRY